MKKRRENIENIVALSSSQEAIFFQYISQRGSDAYFEQIHLTVSGAVSLKNLKEAWSSVVNDNEMLRTLYYWKGLSVPVQIVMKNISVGIEFYSLLDTEKASRQEALRQIEEMEKARGFNIEDIPLRILLCQEEEEIFHIIISHHHILYDGWSNSILIKELLQSYNALQRGEAAAKRSKSKYSEYIEYMQKRDWTEEKQYWRDYLKGYEDLGGSFRENAEKGAPVVAGVYTGLLPEDLAAGMEAYANELEITPASILYTAWGLLLLKYKNCEDIVFGTVDSGRNIPLKGITKMIGLFINTIPVRVSAVTNNSVMEILLQVNEDLKSNSKNAQLPFAEIKNYIYGGSSRNRGELFDTLVIIENYPVDLKLFTGADGLNICGYEAFEHKTMYAVTFEIQQFDGYKLIMKYEKNCFKENEIVSIVETFVNIIKNIISRPDADIESIILPDVVVENITDQLCIEFDF